MPFPFKKKEKKKPMDNLIHFLKHLTGACGEPHPSLLLCGGAIITAVGVWFKKIVYLIRGLLYENE
tara:strand:+ start:365 stop:562 length:198 start_codon:yes stop_codon:yes gene_type:complete